MSRTGFCSVVLFGVVNLAAAQMPALADNQTQPSQQQIDSLVADITAHKQACGSVTASQPLDFKRCNNEQAQLVDRQKRLGLSDDALNGKLQSRGWRWP
jgi:hypothetical protein